MPAITQLVRVAKRVTEATGYLELRMAGRVLDCLNNLGPVGPFEREILVLRGKALQLQGRHDDAEATLKAAARRHPTPQDRIEWLALDRWYRQFDKRDSVAAASTKRRGIWRDKMGLFGVLLCVATAFSVCI